jgi:hypothetical protein
VKEEVSCGGSLLILGMVLLVSCPAVAAAPSTQCRRVELQGQVDAGKEWRQPIGQGWVFRVIPIKPGAKGYSGWDLVMDRVSGAGFPDALLLATPPYDSINQREVGTTFGLRAQDAIGWNPRSFRFLTSPTELRKAQKLYFALHDDQAAKRRNGESAPPADVKGPVDFPEAASKSLMDLAEHAAKGQFRILDARLTPGTADALPYAQNWALQESNIPHSITAARSPTPYGSLDSIKFEIVLWLPANWRTPKAVESALSPCQ